MFLRCSVLAAAVALSAGNCVAQDILRKFEKSMGVSDTEFSAMAAQTPSILMKAPTSGAAERAIAFRDLRADPRMVGGIPVTIETHPWQVALIFASGPEPVRVQFCGGSLIRPNWIVTAAHCVDRDTKADAVDVVLGTAFYKNFGERLKVKQVLVHEGWNSDTMENDIALLQLQSNATQGQPIELSAANGGVDGGTNLRVTGWGALSEGGRGSEILMGADIPAVSIEVCNAHASYAGRIKPGMVCAGLRDGGLDSCQGDSGGPAMVTTSAGKKVLAGVVSWGSGCARELKYGVYTNVAAYRSWADEKMKP